MLRRSEEEEAKQEAKQEAEQEAKQARTRPSTGVAMASSVAMQAEAGAAAPSEMGAASEGPAPNASGVGAAESAAESAPGGASQQRRKRQKKNKGFLAPGGGAELWAMSEGERRCACELRQQLGLSRGVCPSLDELRERSSAVLAAMHR